MILKSILQEWNTKTKSMQKRKKPRKMKEQGFKKDNKEKEKGLDTAFDQS